MLLLRALAFLAISIPLSGQAISAPVTHARDAQIKEVIRYGGTDAAPLTMDRFAAQGTRPHPAAIIVHGGGFTGGTSRNGSEAYCADFLAPAGYEVFSINYRLAPSATFADMEADVARAIRFIRHNAARLGVDPRNLAIIGGSAGGYLSNMAGLREAPAPAASTDPVDRESASVQAVVTLFGISQISSMPDPTFVAKNRLLGDTTITPEALTAASPLSLVHAGAPPFLFIHGDHDESVPFAQSLLLMDALAAKGVPAELIAIPNGMHATGGWYKLPGVPPWEREMTEWLSRTLGHSGPAGAGIQPRPAL